MMRSRYAPPHRFRRLAVAQETKTPTKQNLKSMANRLLTVCLGFS